MLYPYKEDPSRGLAGEGDTMTSQLGSLTIKRVDGTNPQLPGANLIYRQRKVEVVEVIANL
jgi:hypothetical protein